MKTLTISQIMKKPGILKTNVEKGPVKIIWKEPKPNGKVILSAILRLEKGKHTMLNIQPKETFQLSVASKQTVEAAKFYFGAGWDNPNGPVDLDIVCALLVDGKLTSQENFVYFSNRTAPGVMLSEDNQTGEGEGDDEDIVIDTSKIAANVDKIVIGLAAYAGADLHSAPNPHFRVCDGDKEDSPLIADVTVGGDATAGDTVLVAFTLMRTSTGWALENNAEFHKKGQGTGAINGFGALFQ